MSNLAEKIVSIWNGIKSSAKEKWSAIWSTIKEVVKRIVDGIVDKFKGARDKVVDTFEGIKNKVKEIFNKVIGIVNGAIGTVNGAISGIESAFSFGPWKVPTPFGSKTIGFVQVFQEYRLFHIWQKVRLFHQEVNFWLCLVTRNRVITLKHQKHCLEKLFVRKLVDSRAVEIIVLPLRSTEEQYLMKLSKKQS